MTKNEPRSLYQRIYALIHQIPPGHVSSYGQIARRVGCTARTVGFALAALPVGNDVPWQRVVNRLGKISPRADGCGNDLQHDLLKIEGVCFDVNGRIDLDVYGWAFLQEAGGQRRPGRSREPGHPF